jgi:hypothetical protein
MTQVWCVNFGFEAPLERGRQKNCWMMQYPYADDEGNEYEGDRPAQITKNWKRLKRVKPGGKVVAYLRGSRFFATGTVIEPRKTRTATNTVKRYLAEKESHLFKRGVVYYADTPALYEDFSDTWRAQEDNSTRWPQRIDVDEWKDYVRGGVVVSGMRKRYRVSCPETRMAVFRIPKEMFDEISDKLAAKVRRVKK